MVKNNSRAPNSSPLEKHVEERSNQVKQPQIKPKKLKQTQEKSNFMRATRDTSKNSDTVNDRRIDLKPKVKVTLFIFFLNFCFSSLN